MQQIQDPETRKKIRSAFVEISGAMTRIESEKDFIKETIKKLSEDHNIPKAALSKAAKIYHKQTFTKEQQQNEAISHLYETLFGG